MRPDDYYQSVCVGPQELERSLGTVGAYYSALAANMRIQREDPFVYRFFFCLLKMNSLQWLRWFLALLDSTCLQLHRTQNFVQG